ncbi:MAG: type IV pilin protein [Candidatus Avelusimicrobium sp.]|uniref:type IV pilin protein n=1 Tax=Candidatus Avelusimicrobium sp. TaxID=3048833 RepID=UPI003F09AB2C
MRKGFTLIELLVVVLIIGILSSVALPQYTKAVEKSRATEADMWISNAVKAFNLYYLENGGYPSSSVYFNPNVSSHVESTIDLNSGTWMTGSSESYSKNFTTSAACQSNQCYFYVYRNKVNPDIAGNIYSIYGVYYPNNGTWGTRSFSCSDSSAKGVAQSYKEKGYTVSGC